MIGEVSPDIWLREIDAEHLANVEAIRDAVEFQVCLNAEPPEIWQQEFEQAYKQTPYTLKPPVRIEGDTLHVIFLPRYVKELPGFFRFLAMILKQTNQEVHRTEEMHTSSAQERQKREFREALRRIELPKA